MGIAGNGADVDMAKSPNSPGSVTNERVLFNSDANNRVSSTSAVQYSSSSACLVTIQIPFVSSHPFGFWVW